MSCRCPYPPPLEGAASDEMSPAEESGLRRPTAGFRSQADGKAPLSEGGRPGAALSSGNATSVFSASPFDTSFSAAGGAGTDRPRILIVDDEQTVRRVCTFALRGEGWAAESDGLASRALARLRSGERFDALVLDFAMPEMDGLEFLRELRALPPTQQPAVLMASAHADGAVALAAFRLGVWDLLSKPLLPEDLRRRMRRLLVRKEAAAGGDLRAQALLHAAQGRWSEARAALDYGQTPSDELLRGLFFQLEGQKEKSRDCFSRAHWWDAWEQHGPEIWAELSRRLDASL